GSSPRRGSTAFSRSMPFCTWAAYPGNPWPSVTGVAAMRWVRPALTTGANSSGFASRVNPRWRRAGLELWSPPSAAAWGTEGGVPGELLAERHGGGVHEVGAPGLDHGRELVGLGLQREPEVPQCRQELVEHPVGGRQVDGGGEHVVGGLGGVDVVVGVHPPPAEAGRGEGGQHLVHVHVR